MTAFTSFRSPSLRWLGLCLSLSAIIPLPAWSATPKKSSNGKQPDVKRIQFLPREEELLYRVEILNSHLSADLATPEEKAEYPKDLADLKGLYGKATEAQICERLCDIFTGNYSGKTQVGAARYLAMQPGDVPVPYLKKGLQISVPGGVSSNCAVGLADRCRGPELDKTIGMLASPNKEESDYAFQIISHMPMTQHRSLLVELEAAYAKMQDKKWKEIVGLFVGQFKSMRMRDE